jgi:hypothetical protein
MKMKHSKLAIVIAITSVVLILALIGGTWSPASAQVTTKPTVPHGGGKGDKGDNAGCPVESGCVNGLPATGAAPLQAELPWFLVLIPLIIASFGAFTYGYSLRKHRNEVRA